MGTAIFTPEDLIKTIQNIIEKEGIKAFVLVRNFDGQAVASTKRKPFYRVPVAVPEIFTTSNLSLVLDAPGGYLMGIKDLDKLNEETRKVFEEKI